MEQGGGENRGGRSVGGGNRGRRRGRVSDDRHREALESAAKAPETATPDFESEMKLPHQPRHIRDPVRTNLGLPLQEITTPNRRSEALESAAKAPETATPDFEPEMKLPHQPRHIRDPIRTNLVLPLPEITTPTVTFARLGGSQKGGRVRDHRRLEASESAAKAPETATIAKRPGFGTIGKRALIKANHFIVKLWDRDLHHYKVSVEPQVTSLRVNREIMRELLRLQSFTSLQPAYDGRKGLYTAVPLPFESKKFVVNIVDRDEATWIREVREYQVHIEFASRVSLEHLRDILDGGVKDAPHKIIQVLDTILRENPTNNFKVIGRSFFTSSLGDAVDIGGGVESWKGFFQSLCHTQMGMSLNMGVSATSFYSNTPIIDFVEEFLNFRDSGRTCSASPLSERECTQLNNVLGGVKVKVTHGRAKCYRVTKLSTQPTSQLKFQKKDGSEMSVVSYFQERYGVRLQYGSWPALQCGSDTKAIYLPMETCHIVEGQRYVKNLTSSQVSALLRENCKRPSDMEKNIERIASFNHYVKGNLAHEFGIDVKNELTFIDARVLPPPTLKYHDSGRNRTITPYLGQWDMFKARMYHGANVESWMCLNFSSLNETIVSQFCSRLVRVCCIKGMNIAMEPMAPILPADPTRIEETLLIVRHMCSPLQLLIIILPEICASSSYCKIKRVCETDLGITTQCCQPDQARMINKQYLGNVALKINVKLGGINTVLDDAIKRNIPLLSDCPTIVFGADVTHLQAGEDSSASIAAVVGSLDWPGMTKYKALCSAQKRGQEIISDLYKVEQEPGKEDVHSGMIIELLVAFRRSTNQLPQRIIFYRDGVSEGQFSEVLLHEMDAIRKACASLQPHYLPPVTFVVVQKRHHTRLFPTNSSETDRSGNILPGTVVDTKICHPTGYDFYLCSHAGIQGTSRPAHYHVLFDENGFSPDQIQTLTNNLCYTYASCTGSISVVPPVRYAHLAAARARCYVTEDGGTSHSESGTVARKETAPVRPLPSLSSKIADVMFYC